MSFFRKYWRTIVSIAITVASMYVPGMQGLAMKMLAGFASGAVQSGSLEGGLQGAFSAAVFHGIGRGFEAVSSGNFETVNGITQAKQGVEVLSNGLTHGQFAAKILAHATAGGVMHRLQGGKFGSGFVSAGFTEAVSVDVMRIDSRAGRTVVGALVGGVSSVASGGKFAHGAVTGAFQYAFNHGDATADETDASAEGAEDAVFGESFELMAGRDYRYRFNISEGEFIAYSADGQIEWIQFDAYSGTPAARNDPSRTHEENVGPLPSGLYDMVEDLNPANARLGGLRTRLNPYPSTEMFGRGGMLIHADSTRRPGTASQGCIILPRHARQDIANSRGVLYVAPTR